jgi:hypothetical protein
MIPVSNLQLKAFQSPQTPRDPTPPSHDPEQLTDTDKEPLSLIIVRRESCAKGFQGAGKTTRRVCGAEIDAHMRSQLETSMSRPLSLSM